MKNRAQGLIASTCFIVLLLCMGASINSSKESVSVYSEVLRLHIRANSNSGHDQAIKYEVRDGILPLMDELFKGCKSANEALAVAEENSSAIETACQKILAQKGSNDKASIIIGKKIYDKKSFGNVVFPKGEYLSLQILIGSGEGENWWGVLFPPLIGVGVDDEAAVLSFYGIDRDMADKERKEQNAGGIEIFGCRVRLKFLDFLTEE